MAQAAWNPDEKPLDILENIDEDEAWTSLLPEGSTVKSKKGSGASYWSRTARIDIQLPSGEEDAYFLKLATSPTGLLMVRGECASMQALFEVSEHMVPQPVGYGTYQSNSQTHFFLCKFVDMNDELPEIVDFCEKIADLHRRSVPKNPKPGYFGFPMTTCNGTVPQKNDWKESWEEFYIESLKHEFELEEGVHGPSEEIEELLPTLYEKVCPRLLRPLETGGNTLEPCLIHGDLWDGNVGTHAQTDAPYIFDASAFWGHNEYDLTMWRGARYRMRKPYRNEYFKHFPISPPEADWDDRNLLYSLRADLHDSILFPSTTRFRELLIASLRELAQKFSKGYEGTAARKGAEQHFATESVINTNDVAYTANSEFVRNPSAAYEQISPDNIHSPSESFATTEPLAGAFYRENFAPSAIDERMASVEITSSETPKIMLGEPIAHSDVDEMMDRNSNRLDSAPEIRVGESAISPREGSLVNV